MLLLLLSFHYLGLMSLSSHTHLMARLQNLMLITKWSSLWQQEDWGWSQIFMGSLRKWRNLWMLFLVRITLSRCCLMWPLDKFLQEHLFLIWEGILSVLVWHELRLLINHVIVTHYIVLKLICNRKAVKHLRSLIRWSRYEV